MSRSILVAAANVGSIHPADWPFTLNLWLALIWKCVGLILLLAASGLAIVSARLSLARQTLIAASTALIGVVVALTVCQFVVAKTDFARLLVLGLLVFIAVVIPVCVFFEKSLFADFIDVALWTFVAGEMALMAVLWRMSTGGWYNYAIEAVVIVCALTARSLARASGGVPARRSYFPTALAALAIPIFAFTDVKERLGKRQADRAGLTRVVKSCADPSAEIFFVDMPGANRLHGRLDLVYDPWLYPVFESIGLAEPRSIWLAQALSTGPVHVVVSTSDRPSIDGLGSTLRRARLRGADQSRGLFRLETARRRTRTSEGTGRGHCELNASLRRLRRLRRLSIAISLPFRCGSIGVTLVRPNRLIPSVLESKRWRQRLRRTSLAVGFEGGSP